MTHLSDAQLRQFVSDGLSQREIAKRTGIPRTTLQRRLQRLGLTPPAPQVPPAPPAGDAPQVPAAPAPPAPPALERKDIQQWTIRVSKAWIDYVKQVAYERRMNPSEVVEECLWHALGSRPLPS